MPNREFKFGYQHFLLCQKSFLKVSSKWLLKNKSDNGKLLLGKTYSGERFRAILALLFLSLTGFLAFQPVAEVYGESNKRQLFSDIPPLPPHVIDKRVKQSHIGLVVLSLIVILT